MLLGHFQPRAILTHSIITQGTVSLHYFVLVMATAQQTRISLVDKWFWWYTRLACLKGSQLGAFISIDHSVLLPWIQTSILKTWNCFHNKSKRIMWVYILFGKKGRRVFTLFKSIFLRYRSFSNARRFYGKKRKIWKGNRYSTKIFQVETKCGVR